MTLCINSSQFWAFGGGRDKAMLVVEVVAEAKSICFSEVTKLQAPLNLSCPESEAFLSDGVCKPT